HQFSLPKRTSSAYGALVAYVLEHSGSHPPSFPILKRINLRLTAYWYCLVTYNVVKKNFRANEASIPHERCHHWFILVDRCAGVSRPGRCSRRGTSAQPWSTAG